MTVSTALLPALPGALAAGLVFPVPCPTTLSTRRKDVIDQVLDKLDRDDFSDKDKISAAYQQITHMGRWDTLLDNYFNSGTKKEGLRAAATLILFGKADELNREPVGLEQTRDEARATVVKLITPTGIAALKSFNSLSEEVNLFNYIKRVDRDQLSILITQQETLKSINTLDPLRYSINKSWTAPQMLDKAGEACGEAKRLQTARLFGHAADAHRFAARLYAKMQRHGDAAQYYSKAASDYLEVKAYQTAIDNMRSAAAAHQANRDIARANAISARVAALCKEHGLHIPAAPAAPVAAGSSANVG